MKRKFAFVHLFALLALLCTTSCDDSASAPGLYVVEVGLGSEVEAGPGLQLSFNTYLSDEESLKEITAYCEAWDWYDNWNIIELKPTSASATYLCSFTVPATESINFTTQQLTIDLENTAGLHTTKVINIVPDKTAPTISASATYTTEQTEDEEDAGGDDHEYTMSITLSDNVNLASYTLTIPTLSYTYTKAISGQSVAAAPVVNFTAKGSYPATLKITDAAGFTAEASFTITYK